MVLGTVVAAAAALTRPPQETLPALLLSLAAFGGNFCRSYFSFLARQFPICILTISFSHCAVSFSLLLFVLLCVSAFCRNELLFDFATSVRLAAPQFLLALLSLHF